MCSVGQRRVTTVGSIDGDGQRVEAGLPGIVIGHFGSRWAILSLDAPEYSGVNVLVPDAAGGVRPRPVLITGRGARVVRRSRVAQYEGADR